MGSSGGAAGAIGTGGSCRMLTLASESFFRDFPSCALPVLGDEKDGKRYYPYEAFGMSWDTLSFGTSSPRLSHAVWGFRSASDVACLPYPSPRAIPKPSSCSNRAAPLLRGRVSV